MDEDLSMEQNDPQAPSSSPGTVEDDRSSLLPAVIPPARIVNAPRKSSLRTREREVSKAGADQPVAKRVKFSKSTSLTGERKMVTPSAASIQLKGFKNQWVLAFEKRLHSTKQTSLFVGRAIIQEVDSVYVTVQVWKPRGVQKRNRFMPYWYKRVPGSDQYETKISDRLAQLKDEGWKPWLIELHPDEYVVTGRTARSGESTTELPVRFVTHYGKVWDKKVAESARVDG
jgi:hypothetical protein